MKDDIKKNTLKANENGVKVSDTIDFSIIDEYFANGYNGTKAVKKIKPHLTYGAARAEASRLMQRADNKDYIAKKRHELSQEANTTISQLVRNLGLIANADITDYIGLSEAELQQLPYELSYPIKKVTKRTKTFLASGGGTEEETTISVEVKDSLNAIKELGKHLGMYELHNQQQQKTIDLTAASPEQLNAVLSLIEQQKKLNS